MNYFRRIKSFKMICRLAAIGLCVPMLLTMAPSTVSAQLPETMQVAVLDFVNKTSFGGADTGKLASDALVVELKKSDRFDVVMRSVLQDGMDKLGLRQPLSTRQILRLGEEVMKGEFGQASAMIQGEVAAVKIKAKPRSAEVAVVVRMIDVASGEVINGAVAYGQSNLRVGYNSEDDEMITEAIEDAAYQAVKTMVGYIIPEATVQNTVGTNQVLLNKGAREGLKRGMKMIVFRRGEMVGKVSVTDVTPNDSTATVEFAPKGVKPEDKVRAVFDAPEVQQRSDQRIKDISSGRAASSRSRESGVKNSHGKVLLTLLAVLGIAALVKGGSGTENVGQVSAQAGFAPDIPAPPNGGIQARWDPSKLASGRNVVEYHIWRDNDITPIAAVTPSVGMFVDDAGAGQRPAPYWQVDPLTNTRSQITDNSVDRPSVGVPHRYYVSAVYQVAPTTGTAIKYFETDRQPTGLATIIRKIMIPDMIQPPPHDQNVDLDTGIQFQFKSRRGADKYIIQISSSPTFQNPEYTSLGEISYSGAADDVILSFSTPNIRSSFSVSDNTSLYWRVGARNSLDSPGPVAAGGRPGMNYLFSEVSSFTLQETPPPAP